MEGHIGKYTIVEEIGRGAMGIVYKALDPLIDRTVAVKTIRFDMYSQPEQRVEAQKRFLREAKSAGNITHPNIVTIYDMGEDNGTFYIAMEYVDGPSLESVLAERKKWAVADTIRLIVEIADGLDSTHKKGIVHRDIKPGNILIDKEGKPHIVDFGIARVPTSNLTQTSAVMGTPFYMAPEQVAARKIDHRVDIFALGAIFYEMLTLEKPFPGENLTTVIYKIMNEPPHPLREFQSDVPPGLEPIIQKVLAKDPDARYQSCRDLINDLLRYADSNGMVIGDRFRARAPLSETQKMNKTMAVRPAKAPARKPILLIVGAMAVIVIVAFGAILLTRKGAPVPPPEGDKSAPGAVATPLQKADETTPDPNADKGAKPADKTPDKPADKPSNKPADKPVDIPAIKPEEKPKTDAVVPDKSGSDKNTAVKIAAAKSAADKIAADKGKAAPETPKVKETPASTAASPDVEAAEAALKKGELRTALDAAQKALLANPGQDRAKAVITAVMVQTAPAEIGSMINDYVNSLKGNKLLAFYQGRCTPALYEKLRKNVETMAKYYEAMQGAATRLTFDTTAAKYPNFPVRARFSHTITAKPKGKRNRETIFEGTYIWSVEKVNQRWILVDLVFEAR